MLHQKKIRIMVFGTFDILHEGHLNFFKQARALSKAPFLIVSLARDVNVKKIKGKRPVHSEKHRLRYVKKSNLVNKAVLGGLKKYLSHIIIEKPDIIALGYDQKAYVDNLNEQLASKGWKGRIVRLKPFKSHIYKSSLIKRPEISQ